MSANGHDEIASAQEFLARSEAGRHVLVLLRDVITSDHFPALAKGIAPFVKQQAQGARQAALEIELNAKAIATQQNRTIAELASRVAALEKRFVEFEAKRIAEIEQRAATLEVQLGRAIKEAGVWHEGRAYEQGDQVTFQAVPWIAQWATTSKPGTDDSWRMTTKSHGRR